MAALEYPAALPCPQTSTVTPAERRALSDADRPREARPLQRDRLDFERLTWPPMTEAQSAQFDEWWRDTLRFGGAWFAAEWPLPRGMVTAVRKFREQPRLQFVPGGFWRFSAMCEVRGRGELPIDGDDPFWGDVKLLMHMDGEVGSSVFTDSSTLAGHSGGQNGASIAATAKFGTGGGLFNGGYVPLVNNGAVNFGVSDWTVEGWIYVTGAQTGTGAFFDCPGAIRVTVALNGHLQSSVIIGVESRGVQSPAPIPTNQWVAWAVERHGQVVRLYQDGVLTSSTTYDNVSAVPSNLDNQIGRQSPGDYVPCYLDEVRVTHAARYRGVNYTPSTTPFPNR